MLTFLILGGTQFVGRHLVDAILMRGHKVALFNRGKSNPQLFPQLETLIGDRDGELHALEHRKWDVVIDTSGFVSRNVRATATLLAGSIARYIFISSISVYRDFSEPGLDESAPVETLPPGVEEEQHDSSTYGARKALCERAAEEILPGKVLNVRPGIIVGPYDNLSRFTYWVGRAATSMEMLAPGKRDRPIQLIDVRDLAAWIVRMAESRNFGTYNATGPTVTFQEMIQHCQFASNKHAPVTWVDEPFLLEHWVKPFSDLPLWIPETHRGFFGINSQRAFSAGLSCRPLRDTARDILSWQDRGGGQNGIGLTMDLEQELLRLWKESGKGATSEK